MGGAAGPKTVAHIAEFCDGWMPIGARHDVVGGITKVREGLADVGRDPETIEVGVFGAPKDPADLERLAEVGVVRAVFGLPQDGREVVLEELERLASLIETMGG
jgi:alkanesulfonate monooxygenase SsuD/methylene tetrahydromethanopterin reductase-like flavin-dependent oxidoreductase (luciferase family)